MFDGEDFYPVLRHPVNQKIIGCDDCFARVSYPAGAVHIGVIGQLFGGLLEKIGEAERGRSITVRNIVENIARVLPRLRAPDDMRHQARLAALASISARSSAMT